MFLVTLPENLTLNRTGRAFLRAGQGPKARPRALALFRCRATIALHTGPLNSPRKDTMADSIFAKIIAGQIPCHKVYEDERVLAFLDINPLTRGHTLVVPKEPAETLDRLSDESAAALGRVLPRICRAVIAATGVTQYNVLENNGAGAHQAVFHVHFHIIPRPNQTEGLGLRWAARSLDSNEAAELVESITAALK